MHLSWWLLQFSFLLSFQSSEVHSEYGCIITDIKSLIYSSHCSSTVFLFHPPSPFSSPHCSPFTLLSRPPALFSPSPTPFCRPNMQLHLPYSPYYWLCAAPPLLSWWHSLASCFTCSVWFVSHWSVHSGSINFSIRKSQYNSATHIKVSINLLLHSVLYAAISMGPGMKQQYSSVHDVWLLSSSLIAISIIIGKLKHWSV